MTRNHVRFYGHWTQCDSTSLVLRYPQQCLIQTAYQRTLLRELSTESTSIGHLTRR
ncbi:hypothetical protein BDV40DRAFT_252932 [Aspergillus tamarii]|uniref:Uncharacterized protein n=1 Tax=Aspergillus tamarii TaxID=41984 RepID=A0A5N6V959_ASPTM|nr:hypothetical protein BDV40DRAFT_252932 [Aspergillus tamarii]